MINATLPTHNYQPLKGQSHDQHNFAYSQLSNNKGTLALPTQLYLFTIINH